MANEPHELDLPVGDLRVKAGGGLAGHNGLKSITAHLRIQDYLRVRIGVGRPPGRQSGADHVLRRPGRAEATELAIVVQEAADAVEAILADGVDAAMGRFKLVLTYAAENATEEAFAPLLKDAWGELGVDVELKPMLFNQQWEWAKSDPPNAQDVFLLLYWPTYSDAGADNLWSMFHSSEKPFFNLSYWKNEKFDQLVDDAISKTVTDPETAQKEYIEAMNLLVDEAPGLFFFDTMAIFIIPNHIQGFQYNLNYPFVQYFFYDLYTE
jgi:ABC-type oligopeptide transport system substrate-binding subunit